MLCTLPGIQVARLPKACYNTGAGATSGIRILLLVTARRCIVPLPGTLFLTGCAKRQNSLYYKRSGGCSPVLCMIPPTFLLTGLSGWQRPPRLGTAEGFSALPAQKINGRVNQQNERGKQGEENQQSLVRGLAHKRKVRIPTVKKLDDAVRIKEGWDEESDGKGNRAWKKPGRKK